MVCLFYLMMVEPTLKHRLKLVIKKPLKNSAKALKGIDLTQVIEMTDETNLSGELACAGGVCEIE